MHGNWRDAFDGTWNWWWAISITLGGIILACLVMALNTSCATPATVTPAPDAGTVPFQVPACTEANLRQRIAVADGSTLWCVPVEGSAQPRWENVR